MKEFKAGDKVNNRYAVVRKLGAGAMGSVYLCEDPVENNIQVALKVLISENLEDQDVWAKGEYETLTRLRHPNLAKVYNFGKIIESTDYFIVSEFIKGIDLYSATEYVNYEELNDIIVQTCRALDYIHSKGYVHFDIKPDNILVTRFKTFGLKEGSKVQYQLEEATGQDEQVYSKPHVKLIDFGLAERITGSFSFAIKGTLNYLAPEIISGKTPDRRADLYSLGVTLYQITNRDLPHQDHNIEAQPGPRHTMKRSDLFEYHMKKHPEYLRALIMKLLEEDPERRFQTAVEVIYFLSKHSGKQYEVETKETQKSYLRSIRMVGRKKEIHLLKSIFERIFRPDEFASRSESDAGADGASADAEFGAEPAEDSELVDDIEIASLSRKSSEFPYHVQVSGEIGVGKSRLLEEFQHFLRLNEVQLYSGNCYEGTSNAYQPFIELLRQIVYGVGLQSELCKQYQAALSRLLPEVKVDPETSFQDMSFQPDQEKIYFIDRISHFLIDVASARPFVLFVNNLHWADEVSIELLAAILDRVEEYRKKKGHLKVLLISSLRIDEQYSEGLKSFLARCKDSTCCQEIHLRRLKRSQILELLQSMLGIADVPAQFLDRLEEKTGGNPLFIQETLKALQDDGVLKNSTSGWQIKNAACHHVEMPQSLEDLILNRIRKLDPVKLEILEIMSVLNRPISPKILQNFGRFTTIPILIHLRDMEDSGLLSKVFEGGKLNFQIDQPKMREIIYANLVDEKRKKFHGEVAEMYSSLYRGHEEEILEDLAYHYQQSDLTDKALDVAVRAGDRLKAIYASDRALEFYLYITEKIIDDPEKVELWIETQDKVGDLCTILGNYDLAVESYDSLLALDAQKRSLPPQAISRFYRKKGSIFEIQGDYDNALRCYKEARNHLAAFNDAGLLEEKIRVFNCIAWVYVCMGKYEKAMAIATEALKGIEGDQEGIEHAMIYKTIGSANYHKGNFSQACEYHSRSLKIHENLENIPEITVCLNNLGRSMLANCDYGEAIEQFRRAFKNSEEIGDPYGKGVSLFNLGCGFFEIGRYDQAEAHVVESLQLSKSYNMRFLNIENYILYGRILREQKDYSRAESYLFRALTAYSKQGNRWGLCTVLLDIVTVHRLRGNFVEAASMVEEAFRCASDLNINFLVARCLLEKGKVLKDSGEKDLNKLLAIFEDALKASSNRADPELLAGIYHELGDVFVKSRRLQEAKERYQLAEERVRQVLEHLPAEFQGSYRNKFKDNFFVCSSAPEPSEPHAVKSREVAAGGDGAHKAPAPHAARPLPHAGAVPSKASAAADRGSLDCMNELMQALTSSPSVEGFLQLMLRRILENSRARIACVLARNGEHLHVRASQWSNADVEAGASLENVLVLSFIRRCLQTRVPVAIADLARDPHMAELGSLVKQGYRSLVILPYQGNFEDGVIYLLDAVPRGGKLVEDLSFYAFFTNLLPLALMHLESASTVAVLQVEGGSA